MEEKIARVLARLDRMNAEDPRREMDGDLSVPAETLYARRLWAWILRLQPAPSPALRIASRGQHVRRWTRPRAQFPEGRGGYLRWREALKRFHADTVEAVMREEGIVDDAILGAVRAIILKTDRRPGGDPQTMEDALCLAFLETQFSDLARKTDSETMIGVIRKTWNKMSEPARRLALEVPYDPVDRALLQKALAS